MNIKLLKKLRKETGASFADCKEALTKSVNSYDKALELVNKLKNDRKLTENKNEQERIDKKRFLEKEKKALEAIYLKRKKVANINRITVDFIRKKYIYDNIELEKALELQTQYLLEEKKRKEEVERKKKKEKQKIARQKLEALKKMTQNEVRARLKIESIGSEFITEISKRSDLDDVSREIIDLKIKLSELKEQYKDSDGYAWLEESILSITDFGRDIFEALCKDKDIHIRSALAKNPYYPEDLLLMMMAECGTLDEKLLALSNPSCPKESLINNSKNIESFSSSFLRKAVALNSNTPKVIVNKLLEDEYKWVREAAMTNSSLKKAEIKGILEKANEKFPSWHSYQIKSSRFNIVEDVCGEVSIDDVIQAILAGSENWKDHIYSNFFSHDDIWHEHGPTTLVDTIVYPDSSEKYIEVNYEKGNEIELIGNKNFGGNFIHRAQSWESGSWIFNEFELENEFKSDCLIANENSDVPGIVSHYTYDNPKTGEYVDIEGEFKESNTKGTDIEFYVNTNNGLEYCDDFSYMRDEMTKKGLDSKSENDIKEYLENYIQ